MNTKQYAAAVIATVTIWGGTTAYVAQNAADPLTRDAFIIGISLVTFAVIIAAPIIGARNMRTRNGAKP